MAKENKWTNKIRAYALKNAVEHEGKAQEGSVISSLFHEGLKREDVKSVIGEVKKIISEVNKLKLEEQQKEFSKLDEQVSHRPERDGLPELPDAEKGVIMRFAPAPSGPLHIGHIISNMPSSLYVKKYGGKFYVRIEDTDPKRVDKNAYENIKKDCDWLFGNVHEYFVQSDRLEIYYKYALKLLEKGNAYVCTCSQENFKKLVDKMKPCPCRKLDINQNIERWNKMLDKKGYKPGEAVLRFRSDLNHENPAMRDFPLARVDLNKHPRHGNKYRVWPLMNLSVTADDIEYGMTHVIRGKDHADNAKRQEMMYLALEKKFPWTFFMGRVKFSDFALSKRKITAAINEGEFESWEDMRLPTISVMRLRGYLPEAFEAFAVQRGLSEVDKVISKKDYFDVLDEFNRKILHEKATQANLGQGREVKIRMPDNKLEKKKTDLKIDKEFVHFIGLGYCHFNPELKEYWFTHK